MLQCPATDFLYKHSCPGSLGVVLSHQLRAIFVSFMCFYPSFVWELKHWMHSHTAALLRWWCSTSKIVTSLSVHSWNGIIQFSPWFSPHLCTLQLSHWGFAHREAGPLPCFPGLPESCNPVLCISHLKKCDNLLLPWILVGEEKDTWISIRNTVLWHVKFFPSNYSVEGWQKRALETSTVFLAWISSHTGVIHCALYLCNQLLFPLCRGNCLGEFASQVLWLLMWSFKVAEKCISRKTHNPAGCCCMGWHVNLIWGQTACWEQRELVWPVLSVAYWGLYLLTYLITVTNSHIFHNWELLYYITRKK